MDDEEWVEYDGGVVQEWHRSATRIRMAPGVAVIPERAFAVLGEGASAGCEDLREVDLCNVTTVSVYAFINCRSLERVVWTTASAVEIREGAFANCGRLQEIINLSNVTKIGALAFYGCGALKRATIPASVAAIEESAFAYCTNLAEVELGEGIERVEKRAFLGCNALSRINIPSSVTEIEYNAFSGCGLLEEVKLNEGLEDIGSEAFCDCRTLLRISIPSTTVEVGNQVFQGCQQLRHAELQEGLQMVGVHTFRYCHSLERITIPSSVTLVGGYAFGYCNNLAEVTLREGVHLIYGGAFDGCTALEHINIPPVAFVIDVERSNCQLMRTAMPKTVHRRKLVVSKWLQYRSPSQLAQAEAKVNEIIRHNDLTEEEKIQCIREWFAYYDLVDMATLLELVIWRSNMRGKERDAEARLASRRNCGKEMNVIIPAVLPFLEG